MAAQSINGADSSQTSPWLRGGEPGSLIARASVGCQADARSIELTSSANLLSGSTIFECISAAADINPDKAAIIQLLSADPEAEPRRISYKELVQRLIQTANLFRKLSGMEKPSVVVIAPFLPEALIATWGGATAGCVTPVNPALDSAQLISIMKAVQANILVTTTDQYGAGAWTRLQEIVPHVPTLRHTLIIDSKAQDDFLSNLDRVSGEKLEFSPQSDPDAVNTYIPTGGTTGAPKLVKLTNKGQLLNAWLFGSLSVSGGDEVVGHAMPNFHVGGLIAISLRAMIFGQTLLTLTPLGFRDPGVIKHFWEIARRYGMTNVIMAPTTVASLLSQGEGSSQGHSFKSFICGGSTIPADLLKEFHEKTGIYLKETWGMTEFQGPCSGHLVGASKPVAGSVGIAYPYHEVRAVKLDDGRYVGDVPAGERGVLVVTGPTLSPGYLDERLSADLFVKGMPDGRTWASTGDLGTVDSDGYIWVYGREKDVIIRGGGNIDPKVIEEALQLHPAVLISAAIGKPDASKGELPIAYVQLKNGAVANPNEIVSFCRERMEQAAVPVEVVIIPLIPLTAIGKIAKPALRLDAIKRVVTEIVRRLVHEKQKVQIEIDERGRRPTVIVSIAWEEFRDEALLSELRKSLSGFAFKTEIKELG